MSTIRSLSNASLQELFALVSCGEFFRDELEFGDIESLQLRKRMIELRGLVFDALGDPSQATVDEIKRRYKESLKSKRPLIDRPE